MSKLEILENLQCANPTERPYLLLQENQFEKNEDLSKGERGGTLLQTLSWDYQNRLHTEMPDLNSFVVKSMGFKKCVSLPCVESAILNLLETVL